MSSNMYGFTCDFAYQGHSYFAQIVYVGTEDDDEESRSRVTSQWETEDPVKLAEYEVQRRTDPSRGEKRLMVWEIYGKADKPKPTSLEIFKIIALGQACNIQHGWDT